MKKLIVSAFVILVMVTPASADFLDIDGVGLPDPVIPYFGEHGRIETQVLKDCKGRPSNEPCYDAYRHWLACGHTLKNTVEVVETLQSRVEELEKLLNSCRKSKGRRCGR